MRALVAGWFSFANGHATAGDQISRDLVLTWLADAGVPHDFATDPPFTDGVNWREVDPGDYTHLIFVCGPFGRGELEAEILLRFADCRFIGVSLSMQVPLDAWNPFDLLIERDSSVGANPDLVFGSRLTLPPVLGVCLVEEHLEADVGTANRAIEAMLAAREAAIVRIDTRLDHNEAGLRTPGEVEALLARVDAVVTTRLHGLVLALKNCVPTLAIDAVPGGGKIARQCSLVGWPNVLLLDRLDPESMERALDFALSEEAASLARDCAARARGLLGDVRTRLIAGLAMGGATEAAYLRRNDPERRKAFLSDLRSLLAPPEEPPRPQPVSWTRRLHNKMRALVGSS